MKTIKKVMGFLSAALTVLLILAAVLAIVFGIDGLISLDALRIHCLPC